LHIRTIRLHTARLPFSFWLVSSAVCPVVLVPQPSIGPLTVHALSGKVGYHSRFLVRLLVPHLPRGLLTGYTLPGLPPATRGFMPTPVQLTNAASGLRLHRVLCGSVATLSSTAPPHCDTVTTPWSVLVSFTVLRTSSSALRLLTF